MKINLLICLLSIIFPKKKNRFVFTSWFGTRYADNPKHLLEFMLKEYPNEFEYVWIYCDTVDKTLLPCDIKLIKKGSLSSYFYMLTSKFATFTHGYNDYSEYNFIRGSICIQLWHGVAWKKIGNDTLTTPREGIKYKLSNWMNRYDFYLSSSKKQSNILENCFDIGNKSKIIEFGQPRNHCLIENNQLKIDIIKKENNISKKDIIITYMPTFRDNGDIPFIDFNKLEKSLNKLNIDKGIHFINKGHFVEQSINSNIKNHSSIDTQELLLITDILITDYSSCMFDFLLMDKPLVQYIYDYDTYSNDIRGLYFDLEEVEAGFASFDEVELINKLSNILSSKVLKKDNGHLRKKFMNFEEKGSLEKLAKYICSLK